MLNMTMNVCSIQSNTHLGGEKLINKRNKSLRNCEMEEKIPVSRSAKVSDVSVNNTEDSERWRDGDFTTFGDIVLQKHTRSRLCQMKPGMGPAPV